MMKMIAIDIRLFKGQYLLMNNKEAKKQLQKTKRLFTSTFFDNLTVIMHLLDPQTVSLVLTYDSPATKCATTSPRPFPGREGYLSAVLSSVLDRHASRQNLRSMARIVLSDL